MDMSHANLAKVTKVESKISGNSAKVSYISTYGIKFLKNISGLEKLVTLFKFSFTFLD